MIRRILVGLLFGVVSFGVPLFAAEGGTAAPGATMANAITTLDRDASKDGDSPIVVADLIQKEYGTRGEELKWALGQKLNWGEITALAYIQATTGKSFAEMNAENARSDFWSYAENAGMNCEKMTRSLDAFLKRLERERNSRIFDRLRASRRIHPLPDLGSGFGLFQEALDFRRIDSPHGPTKIHDFPGELLKGDK